MTKFEEYGEKINFLFKEAESRPLTEDEVNTIFNLTQKRIELVEQKALKRLAKSPKKNKLKK